MKKICGTNCGIYKIENILNNKVYIGSSTNIKVRRSKHFSELRKGKHLNKHLQSAFDTYGEDNFNFTVIEEIEKTEDLKVVKKALCEKEDYWVDYYKANIRDYGYNKRIISESNLGYKCTDETKEKLSKIAKGKKKPPRTEEHRKRLSEAKIGTKMHPNTLKALVEVNRSKVLSDETKQKISEKHKQNGHKPTKEALRKAIEVNTGKPSWCKGVKMRPETKEKMVASLKALVTDEFRNKMRLLNLGRKHSDETKKKIKEGNRGKHGKKVINIDTGEIFNSATEAAIKYNVSNVSISDACTGRSKTCRSYHWKYIESEDK